LLAPVVTRKPKALSTTAKIGQGHACMRENDISFNNNHSQICIKRSPLEQRKNYLIRQVTSVQYGDIDIENTYMIYPAYNFV
jgi:hypothetical protein